MWRFLVAPLITVSLFAASRIGVQLRDVDVDRAAVIKLGEARGAEVMGVDGDGPADDAGIRPGDVLLSYNGEAVLGAQQLGRLVSETPMGRKVKMEYWRAGKIINTVVTTVAPRPVLLQEQIGGWGMPVQNTAFDVPTPRLYWKNALLGVECESVESQLADYFGVKRGVLIRFVFKESPAEKAGLRAGDVITAVGNQPVGDPNDVASLLRRGWTAPVAIELTRDHKAVVVKIAPLR